MSTLLCLPIELFRMIFQEIVLLVGPIQLNHLRRVCKLFNREITIAICSVRILERQYGGNLLCYANEQQKVEYLFQRSMNSHTENNPFTNAVRHAIKDLSATLQLNDINDAERMHELCKAAVEYTGKDACLLLTQHKSEPSTRNWKCCQHIVNHVVAAAAYLGEISYFKALSSWNAALFFSNVYFGPPILCAARRGHFETTRLLLEHFISTEDSRCNSPRWTRDEALVVASGKGHMSIIRLLLDPKYGCDHSHDNYDLDNYDRAVISASRGGHLDLTVFLLRHRKLPPEKRLYNKILGAGSHTGHQNIAEFALLHGADPNNLDSGHFTPLTLAAFRGHAEITRLLIFHGANQEIPGRRGGYPLTISARRGYQKQVKFLLENGAPVEFYQSALKGAAYHGQAEMVEFLLSSVIIQYVTKDGYQAAYDSAMRRGFESIGRILAPYC